MAVNWARIRELRDEIGPDDFDEVVELFLAEVEGALEQLSCSQDPPDEAEYHFIKSSALNLGFDGLAALCARGEAGMIEAGSADISPGEMSAAFQAEREELQSLDGISGDAA